MFRSISGYILANMIVGDQNNLKRDNNIPRGSRKISIYSKHIVGGVLQRKAARMSHPGACQDCGASWRRSGGRQPNEVYFEIPVGC